MSLPYFPMYPTDFEAKTSHLTLEEDGAYNRLLRLMWMTPGCSLPDDDTWIMRRMRCDLETFERVVKPLICEFMKREKGRVFSPRLMQEHMLSSEKHKKRVDAGKKGGRPAKALKSNETRQSNAKAMPKQPEPEPDIDTNVSMREARKRASRLPENWILPDEFIAFAKSKGLSEGQAHAEATKMRDWSLSSPKGAKLDWLATWRSWINRKIEEQGNGSSGGNAGGARNATDAKLADSNRQLDAWGRAAGIADSAVAGGDAEPGKPTGGSGGAVSRLQITGTG